MSKKSPWKGTCGRHTVHPRPCLATRQIKLSARKLRFPFTFPQLWSCLWEAPGIIYNWKKKRSHLQTPLSIGLKSFWKPKATAPFAIPREHEQQIKLIQPSGKKGHWGARTDFLVTFSRCHNFPFPIISMYRRAWIHNSYPCFKSPSLRKLARNTDTFVSKTTTTKQNETKNLPNCYRESTEVEFFPQQSEGCIPGLYELLVLMTS